MTPKTISNATVTLKANVYFDGKVVSHTIMDGGIKKTAGLIYPGTYSFNTDAAELMEIIAGECRVRLKNETEWNSYSAGSDFIVPEKFSFEIVVESGITEYLCTFS